jgi:hypothetical protein
MRLKKKKLGSPFELGGRRSRVQTLHASPLELLRLLLGLPLGCACATVRFCWISVGLRLFAAEAHFSTLKKTSFLGLSVSLYPRKTSVVLCEIRLCFSDGGYVTGLYASM